MNMSEHLQIFHEAYMRRRQEFDLPENEIVELLENHYPPPPSDAGKIPLLKDRIKGDMSELSCEDHPEEESFSAKDLYLLYSQTFFEYKLFGKYDLRFTSLFAVLHAYVGAKYRFPNDSDTIRRLAECSVDFWLIDKFFRDHTLGDRLPEIAAAARRLSYLSSRPVVVENGGIVLSDEFLDPVHAELERRMELAGGICFLNRLFQNELAPCFDRQMGRYMIHRQSGIRSKPDETLEPEIPFGYLFQLAVKHLFPPVIDRRPRLGAGYEKLVQLATDMLLVFDVSRSYSISHVLIGIKDLPEYIERNSILDSLCLPPQYAPEFCMLAIEMYDKKRRELMPELACLKDVMRVCLELPPCAEVTDAEIAQKAKLPLNKVRCVLDLFSLPWDQVNREYHLPLSAINQWDWPLIQAPDPHRFFMLSPHFSGYGFCRRLETLLEERDPAGKRALGEDLGKEVEKLTARILDDRKIPYHHNGFYREGTGRRNKNRVEFDFILEDHEHILFLEVKKHPLGEGFQQGSDVDIMFDLARGLLKAQVQAYRHRLKLSENGVLPLYHSDTDAEPYYILEQKGRKIHSMSVCLPEYAFFTQAFLAEKFVQALLVGSFHTRNPALEPKMKELNQLAEKLRRLSSSSFPIDDLRWFTKYSYFRSLQQLWIVLQTCPDDEQVINRLTWDRYTMFNSLDFYAGLKFMNRRA